MSELDVLHRLEKLLKEEELDCAIAPGSKELPISRLMVYLGKDAQDRERSLLITCEDQLLFADLPINPSTPKEPSPYQYATLQFFLDLPYKIKDSAVEELASTVCLLNSMLELPGIEVLELEERMRYRYVLMIAKDHISKHLVISIIGAIMTLLTLFGEMLESVASGKMTFTDLVNAIVKSSKKFP